MKALSLGLSAIKMTCVAITFRDANWVLEIVVLAQLNGFTHLWAIKWRWIIGRPVNGSVFSLFAWVLMTIPVFDVKSWEFIESLRGIRLTLVEWRSSFHHLSDITWVYRYFKDIIFVWRILATNGLLRYAKCLCCNKFLFHNHFLVKFLLHFMLFILRRISRFNLPDLTKESFTFSISLCEIIFKRAVYIVSIIMFFYSLNLVINLENFFFLTSNLFVIYLFQEEWNAV